MIEFLGWLGVLLLLGGLFLVSSSLISSNSTIYRLLNVVGSILMACYGASHRAYASVVANLAWIAVMMLAIALARYRARHG
jgi:purine-cytosine permease-like protein